ncbi:hypothetical protein OJ253_388 [Cryptosporidium canis]|uniref:Uncharacterized protein n=1 Tax=Cryptosporidium canis TaxID=195482 RepID=A0A9D5DPF6_9CRYT|nr:hypothetical protein OJ253_388 [Cryptosporidium canis]
MLRFGERGVGEELRPSYGLEGVAFGAMEEEVGYFDKFGVEHDEGSCRVEDLGDNEISLRMFSQELDSISLSRGEVENIWYVELEGGGEILWSSVIACDFLKQEAGVDEDGIWEGLGFGNIWDKGQLFGSDINVLTRQQLCDLLKRDGIVDPVSISLLTSVGFWKSLFLTLNYSTYIRRRREILYSRKVRSYIVRFNKRRETIERRMMANPDEHERSGMIKSIYQGIRELFGSIQAHDGCVDGAPGAGQTSREVFKFTYKAPFYWASLLANIYMFEKLGKYDVMLVAMEYISEVVPELIFEFREQSMSNLRGCLGQDVSQKLIDRLHVFNNHLLQGTSACFQEYLSDLLSITERSTSILNTYLGDRSEGPNKSMDAVQGEDKEVCTVKDHEEHSVRSPVQDSKRRPNYMRPTRLSEIRRQNSRKVISERVNSRREVEQQGTRESQPVSDQVSVSEGQGQEDEGISGGPLKGAQGSANAGIIRRCRLGSLRGRGVHVLQRRERIPQGEASEGLSGQDSSLVTPEIVEVSEVEHQPEERNNLSTILNILEEKSRSQSVNKVNFDDELFNIITEIDKINFSNINIANVSTNISDDCSQNAVDSGTRLEDSRDVDFGHSFGDFMDGSVEEEDLSASNGQDNGEEDGFSQVVEVRSPLDPYDWYYLPNGDENDLQERAPVGGELDKEGSGGVSVEDEKVTTLINLNENIEPNSGVARGRRPQQQDGTSGIVPGKQEISPSTQVNELKYIESILDREIEELQRQEDELAFDIYF